MDFPWAQIQGGPHLWYDRQMLNAKLHSKVTQGAEISEPDEGVWRLQIPAGRDNSYRLAQLDDYTNLARKAFPWRPNISLQVQMRASADWIPGTWGIGFWNNPFSLSILKRVEMVRLPALPEAIWYFFASPQNYLSFRDDLAAYGSLAATFRSRRRSKFWLALSAPLLPLLAVPQAARILRKLLRKVIQQDSKALRLDPTEWHEYRLDWREDRSVFRVDGDRLIEMTVVPQGPLGFVVWVDNQYAAFTPEGQVRFGALENPEPAWIEIRDLTINEQKPVIE